MLPPVGPTDLVTPQLDCRVVASPCLAAVAPALVKASGYLRAVDDGRDAQVTMVFGMGHHDVDWDQVGRLARDAGAGQVYVVVRELDDQVRPAALRSGAAGVLSLETAARAFRDELRHTVGDGDLPTAPRNGDDHRYPELSRMESKVVSLIADGRSNDEIAHDLFLSLNTVKSYIRTAYRKMGVSRRSQAVAWALRH